MFRLQLEGTLPECYLDLLDTVDFHLASYDLDLEVSLLEENDD
jgi:hypothetical protein